MGCLRVHRVVWMVGILLLLIQPAALSAASRLLPVADAYVDQGRRSENFGGADHLELGSQTGANRRVLLRFDLKDVSAPITRATLKLYYYWGSGNDDLRKAETMIQVQEVANDSWDERSVTWSNAPVPGAVISASRMPSSWGFVAFDVTAYVVREAQGDGVASLLVRFDREGFDGTNRRIRFSSREKENETADRRPYLEITTSDPNGQESPEEEETSSEEGCWKTVDTTSFGWGRGQVLVSTGEGFYILSQFKADLVQNTAFYAVDEDGSLSKRTAPSPAPVPLESGTSAAWDGERYVYLLPGSVAERERFDVLRYDAQTDTWDAQLLPGTPYAQGSGNAMVYVSEEEAAYLYAVVGVARSQATARSESGKVSAFIRLAVKPEVAPSWEVIDKFTWCVDDGSSLVLAGESLYFLHGCDCNDRPVTTFWSFHIPTQSWDKSHDAIPAMVGANDGASLAWDGERYVYATVGGANEPAKGASGKEFFRYDTIERKWRKLEELPFALGSAPGNRLAAIHGFLFLWQGSQDGRGIYRASWDCWGDLSPVE